jgi:hypothetical protein
VAHHYTRYLGDLSGGQAIGRIIGREFGLDGGVGTAFYSFSEVPKPKLYKDAYRARLDALPLDDVQRARVLARLAPRLAGTVLTVSVAEHRAQWRNRVAARERLAALLREALAPPTPRRATKPTRGSRRRRLEAKHRRSEVKRTRRRPGLD